MVLWTKKRKEFCERQYLSASSNVIGLELILQQAVLYVIHPEGQSVIAEINILILDSLSCSSHSVCISIYFYIISYQFLICSDACFAMSNFLFILNCRVSSWHAGYIYTYECPIQMLLGDGIIIGHNVIQINILLYTVILDK